MASMAFQDARSCKIPPWVLRPSAIFRENEERASIVRRGRGRYATELMGLGARCRRRFTPRLAEGSAFTTTSDGIDGGEGGVCGHQRACVGRRQRRRSSRRARVKPHARVTGPRSRDSALQPRAVPAGRASARSRSCTASGRCRERRSCTSSGGHSDFGNVDAGAAGPCPASQPAASAACSKGGRRDHLRSGRRRTELRRRSRLHQRPRCSRPRARLQGRPRIARRWSIPGPCVRRPGSRLPASLGVACEVATGTVGNPTWRCQEAATGRPLTRTRQRATWTSV